MTPPTNSDLGDERFWALVDRYLAGECTPSEADEVRAWLAADPANPLILDDVERFRRVARDRPRALDAKTSWERLAGELGIHDGGVTRPARAAPRAHNPFAEGSRRRWMVPVAAAATIIAATAIVFRASPMTKTSLHAYESREVTTRPGQRADVYLSDGTHVLVGPASRLRFTAPLGDSARETSLEGEALFEVAHDSTRPFRVKTATGLAEDLGTRFVVRQYPGDRTVRVVVSEGAVTLGPLPPGSDVKRVVLRAGDIGELRANGNVGTERGDIQRALGWTQGRLIFEAVPLSDAIPELSRWYDVDFLLADRSLGARRLTAALGTEPVNEVIQVIATTLDLRYERRGRTVTFRPKDNGHAK